MSSTKHDELHVRNPYYVAHTRDIIDEFEGYGKFHGNKPYKRMVIEKDLQFTRNNGETCTVWPVIERYHGGKLVGEITFTELKSSHPDAIGIFLDWCTWNITDAVYMNYSGTNQIFRFEIPFCLRARSGKDWYGATTTYAIVGVYILWP